MTNQPEFPQKHNRKSFVLILSVIAFFLPITLLRIVTDPVEGHHDVTGKTLCEENGNYAREDSPENRALLNSTVIIYVPSDDPRYEDYGLGTVIGETTFVTAKHVGTYRVGTRPELPGLRVNDLVVSGTITVTYSYLPSKGIKSGTDMMKIDLPATTSGSLPDAAQLASQENIESIGAGIWVSVVYLEDTTGQTRAANFKVIEIVDGLAKLADPCKIINPGDSGGGVFYNGELIGLTNSINFVTARTVVDGNVVEEEQSTGEFWIAFLSPVFR